MNKLILFIFSVIILITLGFNFLNTSPTHSKMTTQEEHLKTSKNEVSKKEETTPIKTQIHIKRITETDSTLNDEIKLLLKKAEDLLQDSKDEEAIKLYNLIIKKTAKSNDPKLLKHFVTACMSKGYIYQIYLANENDMAIEAYNMIIDKFEKSDNIEFIQFYIDAKLRLSYLLPDDEKIEIYNELVSKFEKSNNHHIQEKIESMLISKSFQLMGRDDEEAMRVLDKVIERYQDKNATMELPENISFSILNNIELALITNNDSETYVDLAKKLMSNSADTKPLLDMLEILKNSQDLNQDEAFETWKDEHKDYRFENWSFHEVARWAYRIEDKETKERVSKYINAFINQKYNIPDKYSNTTVYENVPDNYNTTQMSYPDPYASQPSTDVYYNDNQENEVYTPIEENKVENATQEEIYQNDINDSKDEEIYADPYENSESYVYEPDPYAQEIYEATGEYPNPYE